MDVGSLLLWRLRRRRYRSIEPSVVVVRTATAVGSSSVGPPVVCGSTRRRFTPAVVVTAADGCGSRRRSRGTGLCRSLSPSCYNVSSVAKTMLEAKLTVVLVAHVLFLCFCTEIVNKDDRGRVKRQDRRKSDHRATNE